MIQVHIDLSRATDEEICSFYALPGVGRAVDAIAHSHDASMVLRLELPTDGAPLSLHADVVHGRGLH